MSDAARGARPDPAVIAVATLLAKRDTFTGKPYIGASTLKRAAAIVKAIRDADLAASAAAEEEWHADEHRPDMPWEQP